MQKENRKRPISMIDVIVQRADKILLIRRGKQPYKGRLAIIGGHVEPGQMVEEAAEKELMEEANVRAELVAILGVYSGRVRDERYPEGAISTVFVADYVEGKAKAGSDASEAVWIKVEEIDFGNLAFDHAKILRDYIKWKKENGTYWSSKA